jgi:outer membrane protein OmpA-like peptidoglycan-associated protein
MKPHPFSAPKDTMTPTRSSSLTALALAATLALAACGSLPADNAALMNARAAYDSARNTPQTRDGAAAEMATAGTALNRANEAFARGDSTTDVNHLAYLATQQVALAQQTGRQKAAAAQVLSAEAERDRTRLAARTGEAEAAQRLAQRSQQEAQTAQRSATDAQMDAQASQRAAQASRERSEAATREAQAARQQTAQAQGQAADAQARNLQLQEQMRALNAKQTDRGMVVTISDVLFDTGRAELKPSSGRDMAKLAEFFKAYPARTALVEGFTDSVGATSYNQELSTRRAAAVRAALVDMGVARERIDARGYGESFPVAGNDNAGGRQLNRRAEIVLSEEGARVSPR